jgi:hypothetical protein
MAQKPRQVKIESKSALAAMQRLETKSDDELHAETRFRAAAQAILGARAAERYDAKAAREHFRTAIAAARPQERLQLRRMAEASLALAERRADDLKVAAEKLGQPAPSNRQLMALRFLGLVSPAPGASTWLRVRGVLILIGLVVGLILLGYGIVKGVAELFFGGIGEVAFFWGFLLIVAALGGLAFYGRRRQKKALAARSASR